MREKIFALAILFAAFSAYGMIYSQDISGNSTATFNYLSSSTFIPNYTYYYVQSSTTLVQMNRISNDSAYTSFYVLDNLTGNYELEFNGSYTSSSIQVMYPVGNCTFSNMPFICAWNYTAQNYTTPSGLNVFKNSQSNYTLSFGSAQTPVISGTPHTLYLGVPVSFGASNLTLVGLSQNQAVISDSLTGSQYYVNAGLTINITTLNITLVSVNTSSNQASIVTNGVYTAPAPSKTYYAVIKYDIQSSPAGALVFFNGTQNGTTPLSVNLSANDTYNLLVSYPGYNNYTLAIIPNSQVSAVLIIATLNPSVVQPYCGDGVCNGAETCGTCPADCGVCPSNSTTSTNSNSTNTTNTTSSGSTTNVNWTQYQIYPYSSNVDTCYSSTGTPYSATGNSSASWFVWNGCSNIKDYNVISGNPVDLHAYTDSCAGCVCTNASFDIYEYSGSYWFKTLSVLNPVEKGLVKDIYYTPSTDKIRISTGNCFYLHVYQNVTQTVSAATLSNTQAVTSTSTNLTTQNSTSDDHESDHKDNITVNVNDHANSSESEHSDNVEMNFTGNITENSTGSQISSVANQQNTLQKAYTSAEVKLKLASIVLDLETVNAQIDALRAKVLMVADYYNQTNVTKAANWYFIANQLSSVSSKLSSIRIDASSLSNQATVNDLVVIKNSLIGVFSNFMTTINAIIQGGSA